MKKLIAAAAVATALASPAFAQSYDPDVGSGNIAPPLNAHAPRGAFHAYAGSQDRVLGAFDRVGRGSTVIRPSAVTGDWHLRY